MGDIKGEPLCGAKVIEGRQVISCQSRLLDAMTEVAVRDGHNRPGPHRLVIDKVSITRLVTEYIHTANV